MGCKDDIRKTTVELIYRYSSPGFWLRNAESKITPRSTRAGPRGTCLADPRMSRSGMLVGWE